MSELTIASFCHSYGTVWESSKKNYQLCTIHNKQIFIVYEDPQDGLVLACPECLKTHLAGEIQDASDLDLEDRCETCAAKDNLESCQYCDKRVCPEHRAQLICDDCMTWEGTIGLHY